MKINQVITSASELESYLGEQNLNWEDCYLPARDELATSFPLRLPRYYADLINWADPADPLKKIVLPATEEQAVQPFELSDPIGDGVREAVPGLIHRYPDRCLLLLTTYCLIHCRYCFRREVVGKVRPVQFERIINYLKKHPEIKEVILSGGDPFTFPTGFLASLLEYLNQVPQLERIRFHTRVPVVNPHHITSEWLTTLQAGIGSKQLFVAIHINHPQEISSGLIKLCGKLHRLGAILLSQTVLLKEINDSASILSHLFTKITHAKIKPYYLHHLDLAQGTNHFRISIEEGKRIYQSLRGTISTVCLPEYVLDLPGGNGKVPVMWLQQQAPGIYDVTNFEGQVIRYQDPAVITEMNI